MLKTRYPYIAMMLFLMGAGSLLVACAPTPPPTPPPLSVQPGLLRVPVDSYPLFEDHRSYKDLSRSVQKSLDYLSRLPAGRKMHFGPDQYPVRHLIRSLQFFNRLVAQQLSVEALNAQLKAHFLVYRTDRDTSQESLFTGYYEPLLQGSRTRSAQFSTPIHARPADLVEINLAPFGPQFKGRRIVGRYTGKTVEPYPTRAQIRQKSDFNTVAAPIAWLKDETDLFVLQIQGSGKVQLPDGEMLGIQFHSSNGRPYRSVGRMLIDTGAIRASEMSMQAIRAYLKQHPKKAATIMDHNPRYIFFRQATGDGPLGSLGVPITPYRSLAVDHKLMPSAALAFVETQLPDVDPKGAIIQWAPYKGFALAQDAGSAIKGPGRADFFMGSGTEAEVRASHLKHNGRLYFLVLRPASAQI